jgi:hypothetical protein
MYRGLYVKYSLFLSYFNVRNLRVLDRLSKNIQISNFMKIRPVEAELCRAGSRTDMAKLIVAFRNFSNAPSNGIVTLSRISCSNCVPIFRIIRRNSSKN